MVSPLPPDPDASRAGDVKWFAGLAMQAIIAKHGIPESQSARDEIALWSFRMAQAMVATDRNLHASEGP
jgi:hypothetical protein